MIVCRYCRESPCECVRIKVIDAFWVLAAGALIGLALWVWFTSG
jgi:hypothetical protein